MTTRASKKRAPGGKGSESETDYASATNLLALADYLDRGGKVSVKTIQKRCGVTSGPAKRYLTFLKKHRTLVATTRGSEKFWALAAGSQKTRSFDDVVALELSLRSASWMIGTPYHDVLSAQVASAREAIPAEQQDRLERFVRTFVHRTQGDASYSTKKGELEGLLRAIRERRPCRFTYERGIGETAAYVVHPLLLVLYKERVYLLARKVVEGVRRTFVLESITGLVVDDEAPQFSIPDARFTDPTHVFRDSFGVFTDLGAPERVELDVAASAIRTFTRRRVHSSQEVEALPDGRYRVRLTVAICPELRTFLRALIPDVRVVAPASLGAELRDAVAGLSAPTG